MKFTKIKMKYLAVCMMIILMSSSCANGDQNTVLEISDLSSQGKYCYQEIEWGSSTEKVEEEIKSPLGKNVKGYESPNGIFSNVRNVQMYGVDGVEVYGFKNRGLYFVRVSFGDLDFTSMLNDFFDQLITGLKDAYGPAEEQLLGKCYLYTDKWGKSSYYQWKTVAEDGSKSILQLNLTRDNDNNVIFVQLYLENIPEV
ncbi:hypothetical protein [Murimonas intestini]|uniref:Lipoprotein n=1 Tax=Murimonas intestini TaxID=1337051 RepID=A0AB73T017_9FIRM|nr:hypothetical protein [Murimonas intestini]MCR1843255.1 hypothetical protein [Murimonas intestini]MCR1868652.1 hypothetical protein [Murimonas intestini]MCR1885086.1 hypothetical protein [Murimonas intestini]